MILQGKLKSRREEARSLKETALKRLSSSDYIKAKEEYRLALILDPRIISEVILDYERFLERDWSNIGVRLSLADLYLRTEDVSSALIELEEVLDISPKMVPVYNILGQILMSKGAIQETIELLERALREDLGSTALSEMLAGAYLERGNISKSITLYKEILGLDPADKKTLRILGDLYCRVGAPEEAAKMYVRLYEVDPGTFEEVIHKFEDLVERERGNSKVREMLAEMYLRGRRPDKAVEHYRQIFSAQKFRAGEAVAKYKKALESFPAHPGLISSLAEVLILRGSYTEAATEYNRLVRLGGEYINLAIQGYLKIIKRYPENILAHKFLGDAYENLGKHENALEEYRIALSLDPGEADYIAKRCKEILKTRPDLACLHQVLGEISLIKKEFRKGILEAEEILSVDGQNIDGYVLLGDGYKGAGLYTKACDSYRMALSLDSYNISVHGKLKSSRKLELEESAKALRMKIKEDQWRKSLHLDLAKIYLELEEWDGATKELQEALRDQTRAPFAYNLLGLSFKEQGKFELAPSQFRKALEVLPEELGELEKIIRFNLASTYTALGRVPDAISEYENIREKDIDFGGVEYKIKCLTSINPQSLRNKMFALVLQDLEEQGLLQIWGRDGRRVQHGRRIDDFGISFAQTHNEAGFDYLLKGLHKSAEDEFLLGSSLDPRLPSALNNLAVIYAHQGRFDDAVAKLSAALEEEPKHAVLHNNLGVVVHLKGDSKAAEVEFLRAISIDPDLSVTYINLGDAYYAQGNARQAIGYWEKVKNFSIVSELAARRLRYTSSNYQ